MNKFVSTSCVDFFMKLRVKYFLQAANKICYKKLKPVKYIFVDAFIHLFFTYWGISLFSDTWL